MKTFGKLVAGVGALILVGTLTFGAVNYASAQNNDNANNPPNAQQQQHGWGNGSRFADGPRGWFADRFGERFHNWMGQRMGNGKGMMGRMGGEMLTVVAKALDMTETDLRTALVDGKSVADLASEKDVDLQVVINAIMTERKAKLDEAVAAGKITQERADQMLTTMAQRVPEQLKQPFAPGKGMMGSGLRWGPAFERGFNMLSTVATTLDMSEADLMSAVREGKSVAAIAKEQGVDLQKVIDAILAERKSQLDEAVANGTITQQRADLMLQNMTTNLPDQLNQPMGQGMAQGMKQGMRQQRMGGHQGAGR